MIKMQCAVRRSCKIGHRHVEEKLFGPSLPEGFLACHCQKAFWPVTARRPSVAVPIDEVTEIGLGFVD